MADGRRFSGVWTAIVTPMRDDGEIDWRAFESLLAEQEKAGISGVVISGTTGEAPTLSVQEKISLVRKARACLSPSVRVMAGSGGNNTQQSIELSKLCEDAGADSLLVVTPPYNKPSLEGLEAHYRAIAAASKLSICLYHVPGRTAQFLSVQQLKRLCEIEGVTSVKEASGDVAYLSRCISNCEGVDFLSGDDPSYLASLCMGTTGVISVVTNVFAKAFVVMTEAFASGNTVLARRIHDALLPFTDSLFIEVNPTPVKYALHKLGKMGPNLRLPLVPPTTATRVLIDQELGKVNQKISELGLDR